MRGSELELGVNEWTTQEPVIETPRLWLHHICALDLITLFEEPEDLSIYEGRGFSNPYRQLMDDKGPLGWRVPQVKDNPLTNKWFVRWIVLKSTGEIIGSTSFHGVPDASGMIEIGLGIDPRFHNQGYAKESLLGMWRWALENSEVETLRYTVSPSNAPSVAVIEKFGFKYMGQQIDEEDGPEDIYEMSRQEFEKKFVKDVPLFELAASENAVVEILTRKTIERICKTLDQSGVFHLSLTGGITGNLLTASLVEEFNADAERFEGLHIWWGDERFVPRISPDRNDFVFNSNLDEGSRIHGHTVLPPEDVPDLDTSARRYNSDLHGIDLDLVILGVGPDGHVASLFPHLWNENATANAIAVHDSPKPPASRVSLSMAKINSSKRVWLLACGESKRNVVDAIRAGNLDLPVNHVHGILETVVFVDQAASSQA